MSTPFEFFTFSRTNRGYFFPFQDLRVKSTGTVRDARCWALDNIGTENVDIFAVTNGYGGIGFRYEKDYALFLLRWA